MNWHEYFRYDAQSGHLVWRQRPVSHFCDEPMSKRWNTRYAGKIAGHKHYGKAGNPSRVTVCISGELRSAHSIVLDMAGIAIPKGMMVDHIDGDPWNNKMDNLRIATPTQNTINSKRRKNNTTGYKGVSYDVRLNLYRADLRINGKQKILGRFKTPQLAHDAYCDAAKKHYGEFARKS